MQYYRWTHSSRERHFETRRIWSLREIEKCKLATLTSMLASFNEAYQLLKTIIMDCQYSRDLIIPGARDPPRFRPQPLRFFPRLQLPDDEIIGMREPQTRLRV